MMPNARLVQALQRLAMPAGEQIRYLSEIGAGESADELALEFDEAVEGASLPPGANHSVSLLDVYLTRVSGPANARLWTPDALRTSVEWQEIRRLAQQALASITERS